MYLQPYIVKSEFVVVKHIIMFPIFSLIFKTVGKFKNYIVHTIDAKLIELCPEIRGKAICVTTIIKNSVIELCNVSPGFESTALPILVAITSALFAV